MLPRGSCPPRRWPRKARVWREDHLRQVVLRTDARTEARASDVAPAMQALRSRALRNQLNLLLHAPSTTDSRRKFRNPQLFCFPMRGSLRSQMGSPRPNNAAQNACHCCSDRRGIEVQGSFVNSYSRATPTGIETRPRPRPSKSPCPFVNPPPSPRKPTSKRILSLSITLRW